MHRRAFSFATAVPQSFVSNLETDSPASEEMKLFSSAHRCSLEMRLKLFAHAHSSFLFLL